MQTKLNFLVHATLSQSPFEIVDAMQSAEGVTDVGLFLCQFVKLYFEPSFHSKPFSESGRLPPVLNMMTVTTWIMILATDVRLKPSLKLACHSDESKGPFFSYQKYAIFPCPVAFASRWTKRVSPAVAKLTRKAFRAAHCCWASSCGRSCLTNK